MRRWRIQGRGTLVDRITRVRGRDEATAIGNGALAAFDNGPRNIVDPKTMGRTQKARRCLLPSLLSNLAYEASGDDAECG